jgi:CubicO group peptidase (beta-lactamase class C family)
MSSTHTFMNAVGFVCVLCTIVVVGSTGPSGQSAAGPNSQRQLNDERIVQDLRSSLNEVVARDRFSGAVLLAKNGTILFEQAYGFADHAFNARNRLDTKFNLGSMGKMFTAVAILQLVQKNRLSLNDVLVKVVPDYPNAEVASRITIHQLLTHTSGLGDFFGKAFQDTPKNKFSTIAAHLPLFVDKPLLFEPGTKWSYSNAGFIVLGLVIEKVSGQSYYDYVREHIFKPAGMINTDNYFIDADIPNLALGYITAGTGAASSGPRRTNLYFLQRGASAGGGYSTVEDLLRFADALQTHKLLNKEHTDLAMTGKVATGRAGAKYAYGLEEQFQNGVRIVGHGGGGPGINSNLDMYPRAGYAVAVMSNYDGGAQLVNERLRPALTGQEVPRETHVPTAILRSYTGTYNVTPPRDAPPGARLPSLEVTADEQGLWINVGMGGKHRFVPVSQVEFFDNDSPSARLTFTLDQKGAITGLTLSGVGPQPIQATKESSR